MDYSKLKMSVSEALTVLGIDHTSKGKELNAKCPFGCDEDKNKKRFYINVDTEQWKCHRCNKTGNLRTLIRELGADEKEFFESNVKRAKLKGTKKKVTLADKQASENVDYTDRAIKYHEGLSIEGKQYLLDRGLEEQTISTSLIGEAVLHGERRLTIPVFSKDKKVLYFKTRIFPGLEDETDAKYRYTKGGKASLYGIETLAGASGVIITEGELDSLVLRQNGYIAVSSTGGCGTFREEWIKYFKDTQEIYFCFDNDEAGKAALDHAAKFRGKNVYIIEIPKMEGVKDVTDYFVSGKTKGDFEELIKSAKLFNPYNAEFLNLEFGDPVKEFIPSQFFDRGIAFLTVPLNLKNRNDEVPYYVITSDHEFYSLEDLQNEFAYKVERYPDFSQRWSPKSIERYLKEKSIAVDYPSTLEKTISIMKTYLDLGNNDWYLVTALWIWSTYFYRLFGSFPYFNINGLLASGKSKLLELGSFLAFNGDFLVTSTPAYVISSVNDNCSTIFLDEVEHLKDGNLPEVQTMIQMLNSGYKKGAKKGKKEAGGRNKSWNSVKLDPYSPKMIAGIKNVSNTLISRSINLTMLASDNSEIKNRELSSNKPVFQELRDSYYISVMQLYAEMQEAYEGITDDLIFGRNWEVWKPLFCMALVLDSCRGDGKTDIYNQVRDFALNKVYEQSDMSTENQTAIQMLICFKEMMENAGKIIDFYTNEQLKEYLVNKHSEVFDWLAEYKSSGASRWIGDELRKTGVISGASQPVKIDGKTQRGYTLDRNLLVKRLRAYGVEERKVTL